MILPNLLLRYFVELWDNNNYCRWQFFNNISIRLSERVDLTHFNTFRKIYFLRNKLFKNPFHKMRRYRPSLSPISQKKKKKNSIIVGDKPRHHVWWESKTLYSPQNTASMNSRWPWGTGRAVTSVCYTWRAFMAPIHSVCDIETLVAEIVVLNAFYDGIV